MCSDARKTKISFGSVVSLRTFGQFLVSSFFLKICEYGYWIREVGERQIFQTCCPEIFRSANIGYLVKGVYSFVNE